MGSARENIEVDVLDCGIGNLKSVIWSLESVGAKVRVHESPETLHLPRHLILPGVGAFGSVMRSLRQRRFIDSITEHLDSARPFLGICVGMQILLEKSNEFGEIDGLGYIEGEVSQIPVRRRSTETAYCHQDGPPLQKLPYMNWSPVIEVEPRKWQGTILDGQRPGAEFYFVHSFEACCAEDDCVVAQADHNGYKVSAVLQKGNLCATQFHPEKSGKNGLQLLYNFIRL